MFDYELCKKQDGKANWGSRLVEVLGAGEGDHLHTGRVLYPVRDEHGKYHCADGDNLANLSEPKPSDDECLVRAIRAGYDIDGYGSWAAPGAEEWTHNHYSKSSRDENIESIINHYRANYKGS